MSARVFKPIPLMEMPKIRSSPSIDERYTFKDVMKVRRALFNPDHEDAQRFLEKELAKDVSMHCKRWNFDFITGKPCNAEGPYVWVPIIERQKPHTNNTITTPKRPIKTIPILEDNSELYPPIQTSTKILAIDEEENEKEERMSTDNSPAKETPKKQSLITDFMNVRKRTEEMSTKKMSKGNNTSRPQKIARLSLTDPAS